jgi:acyl-CoA thioester hydrolase
VVVPPEGLALSDKTAAEGIEVWRGTVDAWECDEMGHMNVRFYVSRAIEGLAAMAAALGLPRAFAAHATSTLVMSDLHIRFLREAREGAAIHMTAGVLSIGETDVELGMVLHHSQTGEASAAYVVRAVHATLGENRAFPWSAGALAAAKALHVALPAYAGPRSVKMEPVTAPTACRAQAEALGLPVTAAGLISPADCDVFGRLRPDTVMGRLSDAATHLFWPLVAFDDEDRPGKRIGRAMMEGRLVFLEPVYAGTRIEVRSALTKIQPKTEQLIHWILDPDTGRPIAVAEAIGAALDLDARALLPFTDKGRAFRESLTKPELTF